MILCLIQDSTVKNDRAQPAGLSDEWLERRDLAVVLRDSRNAPPLTASSRSFAWRHHRLGQRMVEAVEVRLARASRQLVEPERNRRHRLGNG